jgi:hypothetical protein
MNGIHQTLAQGLVCLDRQIYCHVTTRNIVELLDVQLEGLMCKLVLLSLLTR